MLQYCFFLCFGFLAPGQVGLSSPTRDCIHTPGIGSRSLKPLDRQENLISHLCACLTCLQFSSVAQSCPTLCYPMNRSTPGLPVHHQLPEFTQTHVHRVGDAIQPSHPLSSPSPPAPNPSQHQGLFQWVNSLHDVAKVLELQLLYWPLNSLRVVSVSDSFI